LKDKIKAIDKQMGTQRGNRAMVRVALVGIPMWENQL
jgi:GTP-binding protein HflX